MVNAIERTDMKPITFPEQNDVLKGGQEHVVDLPIFRDGNEIISCWTPSPAELQEIIATGRVWLRIMAPVTHPPVYPTGEYPFQKVEH